MTIPLTFGRGSGLRKSTPARLYCSGIAGASEGGVACAAGGRGASGGASVVEGVMRHLSYGTSRIRAGLRRAWMAPGKGNYCFFDGHIEGIPVDGIIGAQNQYKAEPIVNR